MARTVGSTSYSIGYCSLGHVDTSIHNLVPINTTNDAKDGFDKAIAASVETIQDGTYSISRELHLYTAGVPTNEHRVFLNYILGWTGQLIVESNGYVKLPFNDTTSEVIYTPQNPDAIVAPYT